MRVFVTGATGFIGSAVVRELLTAGHKVLGLARSDAAVASLVAAGAQAHRGSLEDLPSLRAGAAATDGVIHTAFNNLDLARFTENGETERLALEAIGSVLQGTERPLIVTAGFASLAPGRLATEHDLRLPGSNATGRASEVTALALAAAGVHAMVLRLPVVHGPGDRFTIPMFIRIARETGMSAYIGDGHNRWPAVHSADAASLYRLALENGTGGFCYHAVAEQAVPVRHVAETIGHGLMVPTVSLTADEAAGHFGPLALFAAADTPASSTLTREWLGWQPRETQLLADISRPAYYQT